MEKETILLPNGGSWEIRAVVTRKMRKVFRAAGLQSFLGGLAGRDGIVDVGDAETMRRHVMAHPEAWDLEVLDDAYLLEGTLAWSFPEPVTLEAIDALPDEWVKPVLERMRILYAEPETVALKN